MVNTDGGVHFEFGTRFATPDEMQALADALARGLLDNMDHEQLGEMLPDRWEWDRLWPMVSARVSEALALGDAAPAQNEDGVQDEA